LMLLKVTYMYVLYLNLFLFLNFDVFYDHIFFLISINFRSLALDAVLLFTFLQFQNVSMCKLVMYLVSFLIYILKDRNYLILRFLVRIGVVE